jgi:hypothetical protein
MMAIASQRGPAPWRTLAAGAATFLVFSLASACAIPQDRSSASYAWRQSYVESSSIASRIPPPSGCERVKAEPGSFADWLRHLPLKTGHPPVMLYDGRPKQNQEAHVAVIDMDVGKRDLQQCADSVIRLRAEYLYAAGLYERVRFHFTGGDLAEYSKWREGWRVTVAGNDVRWARTAKPDTTYAGFRGFLDIVFTYAGTLSLNRDTSPVGPVQSMAIGDVLVHGGSPGHTVIVVDIAANTETGEQWFLLAQGYMPAQEMHILKNPTDARRNSWYPAAFGETLRTPEWTFTRGDHRRFK